MHETLDSTVTREEPYLARKLDKLLRELLLEHVAPTHRRDVQRVSAAAVALRVGVDALRYGVVIFSEPVIWREKRRRSVTGMKRNICGADRRNWKNSLKCPYGTDGDI